MLELVLLSVCVLSQPRFARGSEHKSKSPLGDDAHRDSGIARHRPMFSEKTKIKKSAFAVRGAGPWGECVASAEERSDDVKPRLAPRPE